MNYTVPICDECWRREEGDREPARLKEPEEEFCYRCARRTFSGIYTRRKT